MGWNENRDDCTTKIGSGEAVEKEDKRYQAKKGKGKKKGGWMRGWRKRRTEADREKE